MRVKKNIRLGNSNFWCISININYLFVILLLSCCKKRLSKVSGLNQIILRYSFRRIWFKKPGGQVSIFFFWLLLIHYQRLLCWCELIVRTFLGRAGVFILLLEIRLTSNVLLECNFTDSDLRLWLKNCTHCLNLLILLRFRFVFK